MWFPEYLEKRRKVASRMQLTLASISDPMLPVVLSTWQSRQTRAIYVIRSAVGADIELLSLFHLSAGFPILKVHRGDFMRRFASHGFATFRQGVEGPPLLEVDR